MADPTEPKKETVRIPLTPPGAEPPEPPDTGGIALPTPSPASSPPTNPPATSAPRPAIAKPLIPPPPPNKPAQTPRFVPPPVPPAGKSSALAPNAAPTRPTITPNKETARVTVSPRPASAPASARMKKTQPLTGVPAAAAPGVTPVSVATERAGIVDQLPMALCWTLVGLSAVILIIQILNYIS